MPVTFCLAFFSLQFLTVNDGITDDVRLFSLYCTNLIRLECRQQPFDVFQIFQHTLLNKHLLFYWIGDGIQFTRQAVELLPLEFVMVRLVVLKYQVTTFGGWI